MTKRCSPIQRLCEYIQLDGETLYWHGRWRPAQSRSSANSLSHYPQAEFSYDHDTVMNVNRFLFFQLYELSGQVRQEEIMLRYWGPTPPVENEINISLMFGAKDAMLKTYPQVPLVGKLNVKHLSTTVKPFRTIPVEFPEYQGLQRGELVMHYLNGGTDADRPAPTTLRKRKPAKLPAKPNKKGTA